jgi:Icc protein
MPTLRLLQFTDTHLFGDPQGVLRGTQTLASLRACLEHARRRHLPADLVAVTGDLVQDDPVAYGALELMFADLGVPVLLTPGNHDSTAEMRQRLPQPPFQVCGTRVAGRWAILLLDTTFEVSGRGEGQLGPAALRELDQELARHAASHVLVCLHHPPVPMETAGLDALRLRDGPAFLDVLDRHSNVRGVAWGHAHQSLDLFRGPMRLMCTPATCMQFRPRDPGFVVDDRPPGYRVIDLHDDGGIASEVVWIEGYQR